ncbi:MAG: iron-containing redox enzyme family protein [Pseudomonadota bacterium]
MKAVAQKENVVSNEATFEQLESYAKKAADAVIKGLEKTDLDGYKRFLNMMYHYTLKSGDKLKAISDNSPNQELRDYFHHMYLEERNHYMLAKQDLKGFGLVPNAETPQEVTDMDKFWISLQGGHVNGFLGALYVYENIADKVGDHVKAMLQRLNIEKDQRRWLSIHVEVDLDHGAEVKEVLEKYLAENPEAALASAKIACDRWIAVSVTPFLKA